MKFEPVRVCVEELVIDVQLMKIFFREKINDISFTLFDELIKANRRGNIYMPTNDCPKDMPIYASARKISNCTNEKGQFYLDAILYNSFIDTMTYGLCNRSLGHINDKNELEMDM